MTSTTVRFSEIQAQLSLLYGERADEAHQLIVDVVDRVDLSSLNSPTERWSETDVVLITYGDQVQSEERNSLQTLHAALTSEDLPGAKYFSTVHFLPCFPYSSDDGFSVIDYRTIDPKLGNWDDIDAFSGEFKIALDFVVNHVSQESDWFKRYLTGEAPYDRYFIEADPAEDLSAVTRPRSLPLLSDFETSRGKKWLWTTFSRDQLDINYAEPAVLAEVLEILLLYIKHGACIIRLDAIAFLWKKIGTSCMHLKETHGVVKLMRTVLESVAPHVLLLSETNVPHAENVSYFGEGDEAHMVYQFPLPPLLLDALLNEDAAPLKNWLEHLEAPPEGCAYFNFTASHDGVGVRPLEGQVSDERLQSLVEKIKDRGGLVSTRRRPDGTDSPYEMNIAYVDAVSDPNGDATTNANRFLMSQAFMMSLQGVPAVYFHSFVGTQNHYDGVEESNIPRRINRRKFSIDELNSQLNIDGSLQQLIHAGMRNLLSMRRLQPAFHPDAQQEYLESGSQNVVSFVRRCDKTGQSIFVAANFGVASESVAMPTEFSDATDILGSSWTNGPLTLMPAQIVWMQYRS